MYKYNKYKTIKPLFNWVSQDWRYLGYRWYKFENLKIKIKN